MIRSADGRPLKTPAFPVILSGPAGAGKGVLGTRLLESDERVAFSVSVTTRAPRAHEKEGVDYFFVSVAEFRRMIVDGELIEWAEVHDHLYGTPAPFVEEHLRNGTSVLLDIDVQGGASVMRRYPDAVSVFVVPPNLRVLEQRLAGRGTENARTMETRLRNARGEIEAARHYQYLIVNDDLDAAAEALTGIVRAERCKLSRLGSAGIRLE